jgi:exosortase
MGRMPAIGTSSSSPAGVSPRRRGDALLLASLAVASAPGLWMLATVWSSVEYSTHGFFIPVVALAIGLWKRPTLAGLAAAPDPRGRAVIALSFLLYLLGYLASATTLVGLGLVGVVTGCVLALRGRAWLRALAFPVGYLLFLVPLPAPLIAPVVASLRLVATDLAIRLMAPLELPVAREGNVLQLPQGDLFVAEACSGISSVVTLLPAAVLLAYFRRGLGLRALLVASVVPIAVFWNLVRVAATVVGSLHFGIERVAASEPHRMAGVLTYLFACLTLLAVDALALRVRRRRRAARGMAGPA